MKNHAYQNLQENAVAEADLFDELHVVELEDRLELARRCCLCRCGTTILPPEEEQN